jgi:hypothetical protein
LNDNHIMMRDYTWTMFIRIVSSVMSEMKLSGFISTDDLEFNVSRNTLIENAFIADIIVCIAHYDLLELYGCLDSNLL